MPRQHFETPVGAEWIAFAGEHARDILVLALELEYARCKRKMAGQFSRSNHFKSSPWSSKAGSAIFGRCVPDKVVTVEFSADGALAHCRHVPVA